MAPRKRASRKIVDEEQNAAAANESAYEKERRERIAANKVRLAELGLHKMAAEISHQLEPKKVRVQPSSSAPRRSERIRGSDKMKNAVVVEEEDAEEKHEEEEDDASEEMVVSRRLEFEEEDEYIPVQNESESDEYMSEDEEEEEEISKKLKKDDFMSSSDMSEEELMLQKALALSLEKAASSPFQQPGASSSKQSKRKKQPAGKTSFCATVTDIDALYHTIVGSGRGLGLRELQPLVEAHNFSWSRQELEDMISFYDRDKDGMLSLDEFRSLSIRCQVLQPEQALN